MSVERWGCYVGPMDKSETGKYVLHSDYEKLEAELQALAEAAQAVVDANVPGNIRGLYRAIDKLSEVLEQ